jgi:hypothetical protein
VRDTCSASQFSIPALKNAGKSQSSQDLGLDDNDDAELVLSAPSSGVSRRTSSRGMQPTQMVTCSSSDTSANTDEMLIRMRSKMLVSTRTRPPNGRSRSAAPRT